MAEEKKKKIISADTGEEIKPGEQTKPAVQAAKPVGNATGLRIGAIILWVAAIAFEILALLVVLGKITIVRPSTLVQLIILIVLDLACVIIGAQLWKKANHIRPASEKNPFLFWLWNNMGVVVCVIAFVPIIIVMLANKNLDKKTKVIAVVVAIIALLIGGVASYDFNPVSQEQLAAAEEAITGDVYWSPYGHVYHTRLTCQALNHSDQLTQGSVEQAVAANRTRLCSFCAKHDQITGVVTDGIEVPDGEVVDIEPAENVQPAA